MSSPVLDLVTAGSASMDRRKEYADLLLARPELREAELVLCGEDVAHWVNTWCYTVDPRDRRVYPFDLWPKQVEFLRWVQEMRRRRVRGICKKSRDGGFSWLCAAVGVHGLLFERNFVCGFGSRKLEYVDRLGDMKSLFEKCRFLLYNLPSWMMPNDYHRLKDDNHCRILNRCNGSSLVGEGGDNIGRGDRTTVYFPDESAFFEHAEMAETALSATTDCRIDISSTNGPGTVFAATWNRLPADQRFFAHWSDDPRKSPAWADKKKEEIGEVAFASEYDCDDTASVENIVIPARWVRAAINLRLDPPEGVWNSKEPDKVRCGNCDGYGKGIEGRYGSEFECPDCLGTGLVPRKGLPRWKGRAPVAGFDVAEEGKDLCVVIVREGPLVLAEWITSWGKLNTTASAWKARDWLEDWCLANLELKDLGVSGVGPVLMNGVMGPMEFEQRLTCNYDCGGPGVGIKGTWVTAEDPLLFDICPLLAGATPSDDVWPDGKTSKEKFANLRAEGWWKLRRRFEKTYEWVMHKQDPNDPKFARGGLHPLDELVSIPNHPQLVAELSLLTYERTDSGKIKIQSKREILKSPDFADSLWMSFFEGPRKLQAVIA